MQDPLVSIELTTQEAEVFMLFREHQDLFTALISSGIHNIRNGKAILSFNNDGTLMDIGVEYKAYRKKVDKCKLNEV